MSQRVSAKGLAFLKCADQPAMKATLVNISTTGLALRVICPKIRLWHDLLLTLNLNVPAYGAPITCYTIVVRVTPLAMGWLVGLKYMSIDDDSLRAIRTHCEPALGNEVSYICNT